MAEEKTTLMYGDRVRFHWRDEYYENNTELVCDWEGELEGLFSKVYEGPQATDRPLAVVTVTTDNYLRGKILYPYLDTLERIEHPSIKKEPDGVYDPKALYEMRDSIMDNFEFSKVAAVMDFLGWEWATGNDIDSTYIPDESDIRRSARRLMDEVIEKHISSGGRNQFIATGGFEVELNVFEEDGIPDLSLKFVVSDWYEGGDVWNEYEKNIEKRKEIGTFKPVRK